MEYKIGNVKLKNNLLLAPMAAINDIAFRILCKKFGAGLIYTEMANANALSKNNKSTLRTIRFSEEEKPVSVQIFGAKTDLIVQAARLVESLGADMIDFNLGCPDSKVIKQGAGSALLKRPKKIQEIISAIVQSVKIPVTAKIRLLDSEEKTIELAKIIEASGASALAVHARTAKQGYSGKADWGMIKKIKESISIPVIGNGDVFKPEDAKKMIKETGCDFVMIGRAAIGNPGIFKEVIHYLNTENNCKPLSLDSRHLQTDVKLFSVPQTLNKLPAKAGSKTQIVCDNEPIQKLDDKLKVNVFFDYLILAEKYELKFSQIKRQALNFTKGMKNSSRLRLEISKAKTIEEVKKIIKTFTPGPVL